MGKALHTDFTNFQTILGILTKILAFLQHVKNEFSPNLEGVAQKIGLLWQEIQIKGIYSIDFLVVLSEVHNW